MTKIRHIASLGLGLALIFGPGQLAHAASGSAGLSGADSFALHSASTINQPAMSRHTLFAGGDPDATGDHSSEGNNGGQGDPDDQVCLVK